MRQRTLTAALAHVDRWILPPLEDADGVGVGLVVSALASEAAPSPSPAARVAADRPAIVVFFMVGFLPSRLSGRLFDLHRLFAPTLC